MTEPATLPGDDANTIRSGGHDGKVYVHNPLNGEVAEHTPEEAATLVYNRGWAPVSKADATRINAHQILKDSISPVQAVGLGLTRGVTGGLSDLIDPDTQLNQAIGEAHPWLTPISEGVGMFSPLGAGAALSEAGGAITAGLRGGAELGLAGEAATRAAGMGAEGAAYGGIGAARDSKLNDDPLTAQKLLSGMFGGAIAAGALGAGVGAAEGSGSLIRGMFKNSSAAREELSLSGLKDSDISPALERAGLGPLEPGALDHFQAMLYNDPNITPEFMAAVKKSEGIRQDVMFAANPKRAEAEAELAQRLNELHDGNQDALAGWQGRLKRDKIEQWIGPESEHVSDGGQLVNSLQSLDLPARHELSQNIVSAIERAGKGNPSAFDELVNSVGAKDREQALKNVGQALLHGDKDVLDQLFSSKLLNDENISGLNIPTRAETPDQFSINVDNKRFSEGMREKSFEHLRANPADGDRNGIPRIEVWPEEGPVIGDGRHRMVLAAERGDTEITANVVHYDNEGHVVSQGEQRIKLQRNGEKAPAVTRGEAPVDMSTRPQDPREAQAALREALGAVPKAEKLEPVWKSAALDYIDRQQNLLDELAAQPRGYVAGEGGGQIKRLGELMKGARQSIEEGDRANAFGELDYVKKRVGAVRADAGDRVGTGQAMAGHAENMQAEARAILEDSGLWGAKAASAQKEMNAILHEHFHRTSDFKKAFFSGAGVPDPKLPYAERIVADPAKIRNVMDRLVNPDHSLELQKFKAHIGDSHKLADIMEKYYQPDAAQNAVIKQMRDGTKAANDAMDRSLHYGLRVNQGKILSAVSHGGARGLAASAGAYMLGGPLGLAGAVVAKAIANPGRFLRMQAIVERMLGSHGGRVADGLAGIVDKATRVAGGAAQKSTRVLGSAAMLTQNVAQRQQAYGDTLHDLAAMASNRDAVVKAISSWHGPDLAHMPNAIPSMVDAIQRGAQFCLQVAPARPKPGMFSDDELGLLSDKEANEFSNTVHAAMDPATILELIKHGELTPQVLKAAETTAPELVNDMRDQVTQMFTNTSGNVKVGPVQQVGLALLLGVPQSPAYVSAIQMSWKANQQNPTKKITPGNMGDTGVNERYSKSTFSAADRLESGEHQL